MRMPPSMSMKKEKEQDPTKSVSDSWLSSPEAQKPSTKATATATGGEVIDSSASEAAVGTINNPDNVTTACKDVNEQFEINEQVRPKKEGISESRRASNRRSAKRSRERQKQEMEMLRKKVANLSKSNEILQEQTRFLTQRNQEAMLTIQHLQNELRFARGNHAAGGATPAMASIHQQSHPHAPNIPQMPGGMRQGTDEGYHRFPGVDLRGSNATTHEQWRAENMIDPGVLPHQNLHPVQGHINPHLSEASLGQQMQDPSGVQVNPSSQMMTSFHQNTRQRMPDSASGMNQQAVAVNPDRSMSHHVPSFGSYGHSMGSLDQVQQQGATGVIESSTAMLPRPRMNPREQEQASYLQQQGGWDRAPVLDSNATTPIRLRDDASATPVTHLYEKFNESDGSINWEGIFGETKRSDGGNDRSREA